MLAELERLAEKVERAKSAIGKLREDNGALRTKCDQLMVELSAAEARSVGKVSAGNDGVAAEEMLRLRQQNKAIAKERDALLKGRAKVTERVRGLLGKVDKLEELS